MPQFLKTASFSNKNTDSQNVLDQLDPRVRLLSVAFIALTVSTITHVALLTSLMLLGFFCIFLSNVNIRSLVQCLAAVDSFVVILLISLPFTTPINKASDILLTITLSDQLILEANKQGLFQGITIFLKANAIMLFLQTMISTMGLTQLSQALVGLRVPEKLIFLLLFTYRYLLLIQRQYIKMRNAMKARAFQPRLNNHTLRTLGYLIGMMLIRSLERSERVHQAMKCRGFIGKIYLLTELKWQKKDSITLLTVMIISMSFIIINGYWLN